ncbi:hypothetical protein C1H46_024890 [Malus baccata]|uniref:Uncharacterized protein n=1 Tax=Malus baccata TaxID=106549 RepID=A0A540LSU3_MALBA|nr:hypothetical protein C1H46_024890 [Malus baccata]
MGEYAHKTANKTREHSLHTSNADFEGELQKKDCYNKDFAHKTTRPDNFLHDI